MNLPIVNRDAEFDRLRALADSGGHALALVTGRRRVGKTYLLANGCGDRAVFFFTASKTTPEINRRQLVEAVALLQESGSGWWREIEEAIGAGETDGLGIAVRSVLRVARRDAMRARRA